MLYAKTDVYRTEGIANGAASLPVWLKLHFKIFLANLTVYDFRKIGNVVL